MYPLITSLCCCCCSVAQSCLTLCDPMDCSMPGFPVLHHLPELAQTHVHESLMTSNHLILCHPLLLLPSIFPSIRVFLMSWLLASGGQSIGASVSISPSSEYSGLISFSIDWFHLLAFQRTVKSLFQDHCVCVCVYTYMYICTVFICVYTYKYCTYILCSYMVLYISTYICFQSIF